MPIEFFCPGCWNRMRTPDDTAGRKGRCPKCETKVRIPEASIAPAKQIADSSGEILVECPKCGTDLELNEEIIGRRGRCPDCNALLSFSSKVIQKLDQRWKHPQNSSVAFRFSCPSCRETVQSLRSAAGQRGQCPHCSSLVPIPQP